MGLYLVPLPKTNGDFSWKSQIIPTPIYLTPPLMAFPLQLGNGARAQKELE